MRIFEDLNGRQRVALLAGAVATCALMILAPRIVIMRGVYLSPDSAGEHLARVVDMRSTLTWLAGIVVSTFFAVWALGTTNTPPREELDQLQRQVASLEAEIAQVEAHITEPASGNRVHERMNSRDAG